MNDIWVIVPYSELHWWQRLREVLYGGSYCRSLITGKKVFEPGVLRRDAGT